MLILNGEEMLLAGNSFSVNRTVEILAVFDMRCRFNEFFVLQIQYQRTSVVSNIRKADLNDIPVIVDYRIIMFQTFIKETYDWQAIKEFEINYFQEKMQDNQFAAWVAEITDGTIIATAAVSFYETAPKPWNLQSRYAFVSSMYTEPEYRRQGIGGRLLKKVIDYSRSQGITHATLHASKSGKSLYESFGFEDTNEIRLTL